MMDAIAFFRVQHGVVDLWVVPLEGTAPNWTVGEPFAITTSAGPRRRVPPGVVHPGGPAAATADADARAAAGVRPSPARPPPRERGAAGRPTSSASAARSAATGTVLCLGLDPDPGALLPPGFASDVEGVEAFAALVLEAALPFAAAVKPNLSFFEAFGLAPAWRRCERLRARIPADVPVIADGKRADIDTTSARQVVAYFDALGVDAVTDQPVLGEDAIAGYLERPDRFAYVLCRTSNAWRDRPPVPPRRLDLGCRRGIRRAGRAALGARGAGRGVLGSRRDGRAGRRRDCARGAARRPARSRRGLAFLVPGVGAQGGAIDPVLACRAGDGRAGRRPAGRRPPRQRLPGHRVGRGRERRREGGSRRRASSGDLGDVGEAARSWSEKLPVLP